MYAVVIRHHDSQRETRIQVFHSDLNLFKSLIVSYLIINSQIRFPNSLDSHNYNFQICKYITAQKYLSTLIFTYIFYV